MIELILHSIKEKKSLDGTTCVRCGRSFSYRAGPEDLHDWVYELRFAEYMAEPGLAKEYGREYFACGTPEALVLDVMKS